MNSAKPSVAAATTTTPGSESGGDVHRGRRRAVGLSRGRAAGAGRRTVRRAETGESVIHAPSTAVAEALYAVSRETDVRGTRLSAQPETVRRTLLTNGPVSLVVPDEDELAEFSGLVGSFSIHDAMVVASHRARNTEAVITNDAVIEASGVETVWE